MSGAEFGLAVVGALGVVDLAIKYTKILIETYSTFTHVEEEIRERYIRLQSNCVQVRSQLDILYRIQKHLDEQSQNIQSKVLEILESKLRTTNARFEGLIKNRSSGSASEEIPVKFTMSKRKKSKYIVLKDHLDKVIDDVESWQKTLFNPMWFVIMKLQNQQLDKDLDDAFKEKRPGDRNERFFLPPEKLDSARIIRIAFSSTKLMQVGNESKWRLLDPVPTTSRKTVRDLAVKLKCTNPSTFSLLTCLGAIDDAKKNEFSLVFRFPENMFGPETLRARITSGDSSHSLSDRFRIATQLAQAVCSIHTFGIVHKSIRPENVILFQDRDSALGSAFLLGFEKMRIEEGPTGLTGDTNWEKNLYRHPQRQGLKLQDPYIMQHDIYSIGVCLLEIGLWSSFVEYVGPNSDPVISQSYNFDTGAADDTSYPELVKKKLFDLARDKLPEKMGSKYSKIVETCLTCSDEGNEDFGDESEFQDADGVLVAVRYIEKVLMQLRAISV